MRTASVAVWNDVRRALETVELRPQTYATLLIVDANPGCKQQDIADALDIRRPNMAALVDGLVGRALIARAVNHEDRRSYSLSLTPAGRALLDRGRAAHREHEKRLSAVLECIDIDTLMAAAARLARL